MENLSHQIDELVRSECGGNSSDIGCREDQERHLNNDFEESFEEASTVKVYCTRSSDDARGSTPTSARKGKRSNAATKATTLDDINNQTYDIICHNAARYTHDTGDPM